MKKVWIIKSVHVDTTKPSFPETTWLYGKGDTAIRESEVTPAWLMQHGYNSEGAAVRQKSQIPWRKHNPWSAYGAVVESREIPEQKLHYKIYRCYEIVILDDDDNQIGESGYCYGSRKDAELTAQHELKMTLMDQKYREGC